MRNYNPESKYDTEELERLNAEPWQVELLSLNPSYTSWGPYEDYMWKEGTGWGSRQFFDKWDDFNWKLDDLNECVNFYFELERESEDCPDCGGNGYHPDAQTVVNTFYAHSNSDGIAWHKNITSDEAKALWDTGRLQHAFDQCPTGAEVNKWAEKGIAHDAINRHILTQARLERLGIPKECPKCEGLGSVYIKPKARVGLVLWILHPRKGCSRGVEIKHVAQEDLPVIFEWLRIAAQRNTDRFSKIPTTNT